MMPKWARRIVEAEHPYFSLPCDADPEEDGSTLHHTCTDKRCQCGCHAEQANERALASLKAFTDALRAKRWL